MREVDQAHPRKAVLVIGESLIDIVRRADGMSESPGGAPANVALGLGRLGVGVRFLTALGCDDHGQRIAAHQEDSGVLVDERSWILPRTSTATAKIGADGSATYDFALEAELPTPELDGAKTVHVGSISMFVEPGADVVQSFIGALPTDVLVSVDPNIRHEIVEDHPAAVDRFENILRRAQIVKLSDEDAQWLYPGLSIELVLDHVLKFGPRVAAITIGAGGATLATPGARVHVGAPRVDVVDTIGAGDTFMAALLFRSIRDPQLLFRGDVRSLEKAGEFAAAAASITVRRRGGDLPWACELASASQ